MRGKSAQRAAALGITVGLIAALVGVTHAVAGDVPYVGVVTEQEYQCGPNDHTEANTLLGIQGDVPLEDQISGEAEKGYNCGLTLLGHATLSTDGRQPTGNANMAWAGDCAYVSGPGALTGEPNPRPGWGVAVVQVSGKGIPTHVKTLRSPGSRATSETLHAVDTPERSILVVGQYGNAAGAKPNPMDVFDVSDCANPIHLEGNGSPTPAGVEPSPTFDWPRNIHNLTISANGRYVFATQPLQVLDLAPLFDGDPSTALRQEDARNIEAATPSARVSPGPLADLDDDIEDDAWSEQRSGYLSHEAWPSPDGTKVYVGGQLPTWETLTILDIKDWLADPVNARPKVISQKQGRGHSVRTATIGGKRFVLHSEESVLGPTAGCLPETLNPAVGPAQPWLTDISNEENPQLISQFGLEINEAVNCPEAVRSNVRTGVHYHDVDNEDDTTFVMASMWNAGVRVFDVRDPARPVEVAYFNPGDVDPSTHRVNPINPNDDGVVLDRAWGHVRWLANKNQMWFATESGGFWVAELQNQVLAQLGLDKHGRVAKARLPEGRSGREGVATSPPAVPLLTVRLYCTLSAAQVNEPDAWVASAPG